MVERVLSMHEAMGSMPIFSNELIISLREEAQHRLLSRVRLPTRDATVSKQTNAPLAQSAERRSHNPNPATWLRFKKQS